MRELLIKDDEIEKQFYLIENEKLVEVYKEKNERQTIEGNIYIGKVQNIISGLDAAFINIGENKNAFIHKKDILPKVDITKEKLKNEAPITKLIKPGMPILVEVKKDKMHNKGAKVSTHITLRGRFIVLMPNSPFITISNKIEEYKKIDLKERITKLLPKNMGIIIRTNAQFAEEEQIKKDIEKQLSIWEKIKNTELENPPKKIYDSAGILKKTIVDLVDYNLDKIIVNSERLKQTIEKILLELDSKIEIQIKEDIEKLYNINKELEKLKNNKIWLKSGAFITIDTTEALIAIDVNSGKFIGSSNTEETIYKVNAEAAIEIAKQLRLRDIGGIIIIDFIDMKNKENLSKLQELLKEEAKKDRSRLQIESFTKLNLLECTRKNLAINI